MAVPALIAAILFFMSGGDVVIISLAFALLVWSLFASRARSRTLSTTSQKPTAPPAEDPPNFLRAGIEWCRTMSGAKRVILWQVDDAAGLVRPVVAAGGTRPNPHVLHGSPVTWVAREGVSSRISPPPEWAEALRVIGVRVLDARSSHALTLELVDDIDVSPEQFEALGIHMGALLDVVNDHRAFDEKNARNDMLITTLRALPDIRDARGLGHELIALAIRMTGATGAAVIAWGGERGEVVAAEGAGMHAGQILSDSQSLTTLAARGAGTLIRQGSALRGIRVLSESEKIEPAPVAVAAIPLVNQREVIGVLTVWTALRNRIEESSITMIESIAPYAAMQLQQARELIAIRAMADQDVLTGLANRRAFESLLNAEWARWERYKRTFSLLMFDIDHFKSINDKLGHDGGDEVLATVAGTLSRTLRNIDFAARYGGEEFAVILPETNAKLAAEIAERVRSRIEGMTINHRGQSLKVTVSGGVADASSNLTAADMVRTADQLLYRAKTDGRNRIATTR